MPTFTRADALEAARLGLTRDEYAVHVRNYQRTPERPRSGRTVRRGTDTARPLSGNRIELAEGEYKELCLVAAITKRLFPILEQTSAPVTHHGEFEALREALDRIGLYGWATTGTEQAVGDLLGILDATKRHGDRQHHRDRHADVVDRGA